MLSHVQCPQQMLPVYERRPYLSERAADRLTGNVVERLHRVKAGSHVEGVTTMGSPEPASMVRSVLSRYICEHVPSLYTSRAAAAREPIRT